MKGLEAKKSDCPLRTKYFDREKGLVYSLKLNSEKNWRQKKRENQNQCHCYSNHFKLGW